MKSPFKRLKIVEQFVLVLIVALIAPLLTIAIIINNINQHGIRNELRQSAVLTADIMAQRINSMSIFTNSMLDDVILAINCMPKKSDKIKYLKSLEKKSDTFKTLSLVENTSKFKNKQFMYDETNKNITNYAQISPNKALKVTFDTEYFKKELLQSFEKDERQFYILSTKSGSLLLSHNFSKNEFEKTYSLLPKHLEENKAEIFGDVKNQPLAYYKIPQLNLLILINTTKQVTHSTITSASISIFSWFVLAVCVILFIVGLYIYYLYINMRQLLKGLVAVTKGNYTRKVRLLVSIFTPHEIVFVAGEFNKMVKEINKSYKELNQKNIELKKLDEFRSNLIDTVSHELRTPLTSIKGYTSRLLRQDIEIDEQTKIKSLNIIKRQSERLSHMVEDLLSIPDIENSKLKIKLETVNLSEVFDVSVAATSNSDGGRFKVEIQQGIKNVVANKDKLEQVVINVLENALKYSDEDSLIELTARKNRNNVIIAVQNKADYIPKEILSHLFEKFTRVDDKTTRETRGTGLGLYIVKGVVKAMNGDVAIYSTKDRTFKIEIKLKAAFDE